MPFLQFIVLLILLVDVLALIEARQTVLDTDKVLIVKTGGLLRLPFALSADNSAYFCNLDSQLGN
jgi:hypothetical protein